jgi:hypothetical protein
MSFETHNEDVEEAAQKAFSINEATTMAVVSELQNKGDKMAPHHLYVVLTAAAAAIQIAARIMSMPEVDDINDPEAEVWASGPVNRNAVLAASLLLSRCLLPSEDGMTFEFNPINVRAALEATKNITGNADTSMFTQQMVKAANKFPLPGHFFDNSRSADVVDLSKFRVLN